MKKFFITLFLVLLFSVGSTSVNANYDYKDVKSNHWAFSKIQEATKLGYFVGDGNGYFKPDGNVTRAEFAQVLSKLFEVENLVEEPFIDITDNYWGKEAIEKLLTIGVIDLKDYPNYKFEPTKPMTRIELAKWFTNALSIKDPSYQDIMKTIRDSQHTLLPVTEYLKGGIEKVEQGYIGVMLGTELFNGYIDGSFKPNGNTSRSEVAHLIIKFKSIQDTKPTDFKGLNEILEVSETATNMLSATKFVYSNDNTVKDIVDKPTTLNNNVGTAKIHRIIFVDSTKSAKETLKNSIYAKMFFGENQKYFLDNTVAMYIDLSVTPNRELDILTLANSSYTGFIRPSRLLYNVDKYGFTTLPLDLSTSKFFTVGKEKRYWTEQYNSMEDPSIRWFKTNDNTELLLFYLKS